MPQAWDAFNNSFIRKLKRPEYWGYNPNQAYGANMLFRSEETNPWAGRDQLNAKFGVLGGTNNRVGTIPTANMGGMAPSPLPSPQSSFEKLMAGTGSVASTYASKELGNKGYEWLKGLFGGAIPSQTVASELAEMGGGYAKLAGLPISGDPYADIGAAMTEKAIAPEAASAFTAPDPLTLALSMAPIGMEAITGSKTAGRATGAAVSTGIAASQGFANPISDAKALWDIIRLFGGLF